MASKSDLEKAIAELNSDGKGLRILAKKVNGKSARAVGFYDVANHLALRIVKDVSYD